MNTHAINIPESKKRSKLVFEKSFFEKLSEWLIEIPTIVFIPVLCGLVLFEKISTDQPFFGTLVLFALSIALSVLLIYSISRLNSLERIKGISKEQNSKLVMEISEDNNWRILTKNEKMTIIGFSWKESGMDWGKQMTILYDAEDILVNCISYGLFSTPSPFHWFANRKKVSRLKYKFKKRVDMLQNNTES